MIINVALMFISIASWGQTPKSYPDPDLKYNRSVLRAPESLIELKTKNIALETETYNHKKQLEKIKYYLTNGEIRLAKVHLSKLTHSTSKLRPIIQRYLAIVAFIEGNYQKSYEHLDQVELQSIPHFSKVCILKVVNEIILNKLNKLKEDWSRCQLENGPYISGTNIAWLDTLVNLKLYPETPGITRIPFKGSYLRSLSDEELKVILKLALYLNQEALVEPQLTELTQDHIKDPEIRELIGHIYFRMGKLTKSYRFIEDLKSPNSENIKGNLYIWRNKYEIAYAQFKLALDQKQNSQNAMERLLPLAWILGDWKGGQEYAEKVIASPQTLEHKVTLLAAFLTQKTDFELAEKALESISVNTHRGQELEITQLYSFVLLMQNKTEQAKKYATLSCEQYDILHCWSLFQLSQWEAFSMTIKREEKIETKKQWEKLVAQIEIDPLKEAVFINQVDIEEMDDRLIQLIPKTP